MECYSLLVLWQTVTSTLRKLHFSRYLWTLLPQCFNPNSCLRRGIFQPVITSSQEAQWVFFQQEAEGRGTCLMKYESTNLLQCYLQRWLLVPTTTPTSSSTSSSETWVWASHASSINSQRRNVSRLPDVYARHLMTSCFSHGWLSPHHRRGVRDQNHRGVRPEDQAADLGHGRPGEVEVGRYCMQQKSTFFFHHLCSTVANSSV